MTSGPPNTRDGPPTTWATDRDQPHTVRAASLRPSIVFLPAYSFEGLIVEGVRNGFVGDRVEFLIMGRIPVDRPRTSLAFLVVDRVAPG